MRCIGAAALAALPLLASPTLRAETRYTEKQIAQFSTYVGKSYWISPENKQQPAFLSAPSPDAETFQPAAKESFELKEIVDKHTDTPYYRAAFASGKEGFIPVTVFLQQLNGSFMSNDPDRSAKAKSAKEVQEEEKRRDWIREQKWPEHVKNAALNKQPVLGMNKKEASAVLGKPKSVVRLKRADQLMGRQEQWIYDSGAVLTFSNGVIVRIQ